MLNPKAYLFMLAVFPQFLRPEHGNLWLQALVLWLIIASIQTGVYGSVAVTATRVRGLFAKNATAGTIINRAVGSVLILVAVLTAYDGWHQP